MRIKDKIALVTGGSRGIGKAICLRLAEEGARVAVVDILEREAEETAGEIKGKGGQAIAIKTDVTQLDHVRACVRKVEETWGPVEVLINNAGWDKVEPFVDSKPETWERVIGINLKGPIHFCHTVIPKMVAHGSLISQGTSENWELGNMKKSILTKNHTGKSSAGHSKSCLCANCRNCFNAPVSPFLLSY